MQIATEASEIVASFQMTLPTAKTRVIAKVVIVRQRRREVTVVTIESTHVRHDWPAVGRAGRPVQQFPVSFQRATDVSSLKTHRELLARSASEVTSDVYRMHWKAITVSVHLIGNVSVDSPVLMK